MPGKKSVLGLAAVIRLYGYEKKGIFLDIFELPCWLSGISKLCTDLTIVLKKIDIVVLPKNEEEKYFSHDKLARLILIIILSDMKSIYCLNMVTVLMKSRLIF